MYVKPRQNASSSLKFRLERVELAVYVADAEPALIVLVPDTTIVPSIDKICFSPAAKLPTDQVRVLSSITAKPEFSNEI